MVLLCAAMADRCQDELKGDAVVAVSQTGRERLSASSGKEGGGLGGCTSKEMNDSPSCGGGATALRAGQVFTLQGSA